MVNRQKITNEEPERFRNSIYGSNSNYDLADEVPLASFNVPLTNFNGKYSKIEEDILPTIKHKNVYPSNSDDTGFAN